MTMLEKLSTIPAGWGAAGRGLAGAGEITEKTTGARATEKGSRDPKSPRVQSGCGETGYNNRVRHRASRAPREPSCPPHARQEAATTFEPRSEAEDCLLAEESELRSAVNFAF